MTTKLFEIRDRGTLIPVMATKMRTESDGSASEDETMDAEEYLLHGSGFNPNGKPLVVLCRLECSGVDGNATYDPFAWGGGARTLKVAHRHIIDHFDELPSGAVVDVEFILGETKQPKITERLTT